MRDVEFEKLFGSTKLFLDFINFRDKASSFFEYDFRDISAYKTAAKIIDQNSYPREKLVSIIREGLTGTGITPQIEKNIEKLSRPDSLVVFAGQQVGVFLGPMYTIIKALTSYKLAAKLEAELGRPVVPCFWMASDDHDFDEVKKVILLDRQGECAELSYEPKSGTDNVPMTEITLDESFDAFLDQAQASLIETEFTPDILKLLKEAYKTGTPLSQAFAALFNDFLGEFGIVPVDPNFPGMKNHMAEVFRTEIENHKTIFDIFELRSQEIMDAGYHRQVHKTGDNLNLFISKSGRRNIIVENGKFGFDGTNEVLEKTELLGLLEKRPEIFSPNVCLRPVAQCSAFPTIGQITGPSEAAYFAQIKPIFEFMKVPFPVISPRLFATIIEPQVKRNIDKLSLNFVSLYNDIEGEINRAITELYPPETVNKTESLRPDVERPIKDLADSLKSSEPEGYQALEHALKRIDHELNHLSKKLLALHKKRHDTVRSQIYKASSFLFPCGKYQERVISPVYFADKFGPDIFKKIEEKLDLESTAHQLLEIGN